MTRIVGSDDGVALLDCAGSDSLPAAIAVELHMVSDPARFAITDIRIVSDDVTVGLAACISALAHGLEERSPASAPFLRSDAWLRRELLLP